MIVVPPATCQQEVYLIDRKNNYHQIRNIYFPHHEPQSPVAIPTLGQRTNTILDGELVIDTISPGKNKLCLLLFDCLVVDGENVTRKALGKRYGRLRNQILPAYHQSIQNNKMARLKSPFDVQLKPMDVAYGLETVFQNKMKHLQHQTDGLIFTSFSKGYSYGTDPNILKWKPSHDNTIDFKLQLRFPADLKADPSGATPDLKAKPFFQLLQHVKGRVHEPFDYLEMSDEEWERWKDSGEQLDDRIVECAWHPPAENKPDEPTWHITRIRSDKQNANHKSTVTRIIESIKDAVDEQELINFAPQIRAAWKTPYREKVRVKNKMNRKAPIAHLCKSGGGPGPPMVRGGMPGIVRR